MIDCTPEMWAQHARAFPGFAKKKNHVWAFYDEWCEIWGNDRATGKGAKDLREAAAKILRTVLLESTETELYGEEVEGNEYNMVDEDVDSSAPSDGGPHSKRARTTPSSNPASDMDSCFFSSMDKVITKAVEDTHIEGMS